jgi:hypothetical protein
MRIARKLLLLAMMAIAAMAFTASTAVAQEETEVEVVDEADDHAPCNPCNLHARGESHIFSLVAGAEVSTCEDEFNGKVYHGGGGEIEWTGAVHGAPGCNTTNCQAGDEDHWPIISPITEVGGEVEHFDVRFCLRSIASGAESHCEGEVTIERTETRHVYELHATIVDTTNCLGRRIEVHATTEYNPVDGDNTVEY